MVYERIRKKATVKHAEREPNLTCCVTLIVSQCRAIEPGSTSDLWDAGFFPVSRKAFERVESACYMRTHAQFPCFLSTWNRVELEERRVVLAESIDGPGVCRGGTLDARVRFLQR